MKTRLCNKCNGKVNYPFYQVALKEAPKKVKEKNRYGEGGDWEHMVYPSSPCADICAKCWKALRINSNEKTFDYTAISKEAGK